MSVGIGPESTLVARAIGYRIRAVGRRRRGVSTGRGDVVGLELDFDVDGLAGLRQDVADLAAEAFLRDLDALRSGGVLFEMRLGVLPTRLPSILISAPRGWEIDVDRPGRAAAAQKDDGQGGDDGEDADTEQGQKSGFLRSGPAIRCGSAGRQCR